MTPSRFLKTLLRTAAVALAIVMQLSGQAIAGTPDRELPDYDGRGGPPSPPGKALLWVPRVVLFPLYLTSEYVIRRPLGWLISGAERAQVPAALYDFFAFGPGRALFRTGYEASGTGVERLLIELTAR